MFETALIMNHATCNHHTQQCDEESDDKDARALDGDRSIDLLDGDIMNDDHDSAISTGNSACNNNNNNNGDASSMLLFTVLHSPAGSALGLDGVTRILSRPEPILAIRQIPLVEKLYPTQRGNGSQFHLVTIRAGRVQKRIPLNLLGNANTENDSHQLPHHQNGGIKVGFVFFGNPDNCNATPCCSIRQFDPRTEEVSATAIEREDRLTLRNVWYQVQEGHVPPHACLDYREQWMKLNDSRNNNSSNTAMHNSLNQWQQHTNWIRPRLVQNYRHIQSGDKIIPGSYPYDDLDGIKLGSASHVPGTDHQTAPPVDGKLIQYPPIPILLDFDSKSRNSATNYQQQHKQRRRMHEGTLRFLALLPPPHRTQLLFGDDIINSNHRHYYPPTQALEWVLARHYHNDWYDLIGDLQLSFVLFLYLHCYASWQHWRDLLVMLSCVDRNGIVQYSTLYRHVLEIWAIQLCSIDSDLVMEYEPAEDNNHGDDDMGNNGGRWNINNDGLDFEEDNDCFLIPSLYRVIQTVQSALDETPDLHQPVQKLQRELMERFPQQIEAYLKKQEQQQQQQQHQQQQQNEQQDPKQLHRLLLASSCKDNLELVDGPMDHSTKPPDAMPWNMEEEGSGDDDDDDDGPVIVPIEEVNASLARSKAEEEHWVARRLYRQRQHVRIGSISSNGGGGGGGSSSSDDDDDDDPPQDCNHDDNNSASLRRKYPILFAAMIPHYEDILMTCARALHDATDVSLVREAAAYLEQVEKQGR